MYGHTSGDTRTAERDSMATLYRESFMRAHAGIGRDRRLHVHGPGWRAPGSAAYVLHLGQAAGF